MVLWDPEKLFSPYTSIKKAKAVKVTKIITITCAKQSMPLHKRVYLMPSCALCVISSPVTDREPSSSSYNVSSGTFYSCVSQITIGKCTLFKADCAHFIMDERCFACFAIVLYVDSIMLCLILKN